MGWYYYLQDRIRFPIQARCVASKLTSPLRSSKRGDRAVIERLREEALGFLDFYWPGDRVLKIPFDSCEFRD